MPDDFCRRGFHETLFGPKGAVRLLALLMLVLWVGLILEGTAFAACPNQLDDRRDVASNPTGYDYNVYFTNDDPADSDYFPSGRAIWVRDTLATTHPIWMGVPYGFEPPNFHGADPQDTCIYDFRTGVFADAPKTRIRIQSTTMDTKPEPWIRKVTGHELFHHIQYATIDFDKWASWGAWVVEGTARYMEDKTFVDNDTTAANTAYVGAVNNVLGDPNRNLTDLSYRAAIFWNYAAEQTGSETGEPEYGVDFMQQWWANANGKSPDSFGNTRETLVDMGEIRSLESLFSDFQISMYTHDLDVSSLADPSPYLYVDETTTGGGTAYNAVSTTDVPAADTTYSDSVERWAGRHFEAVLDTTQECSVIGYYGKAQPGKELGWAIVGVKDGNLVSDIYQGRGNEFYRAIIESPSTSRFGKLGFVVTGLRDSATFDYSYGAGPPSGSIRLPFSQRKARVGDIGDPPERFLTRLLLQGPAGLTPDGTGIVSVKGLDASLFDLRLRSDATGVVYDDATILTARYVDGEYWLTVQSPEITNPADGTLYDLEICFCGDWVNGCAASMTSAKSVLYENEILNQVLTMDRSFSMHYPEPAETAKITAARNAARSYVDAANDDDLMTVVAFDGDDAECNFDAVTMPNSGGLIPVVGNQATLRADVNLVVEAGWTSIGDGIRQARDELAAALNPDDVRAIVLMSDGLENEGDFWASANADCGTPPVRDSFDPGLGGPAADMRIDTLAFGADSNQELLEDIADFTDGLALAVSTDTPVAAAAAAATEARGPAFSSPGPHQLEIPNRLANAYRTIEETIRGQDRLSFHGLEMAAGVSEIVQIHVDEVAGGGVADSVFAINWHLEAANVTAKLYAPGGSLITPGTPGWNINTDMTNQVYLYDGILPPGVWEVALTSNIDVQATIALSGRVVHGVAMELDLSQVRGHSPYRECDHHVYGNLRGLPVTVIASLSDIKGGINGLTAEAEVLNADGSVNRLTLFDDGAHEDELANDGVYANRYTKTPFFSRGGVADFPAGPPTGQWGSYSVVVDVTGRSNYGETFNRNEERSYHVYEFPEQSCDPDSDNDGLPDRWEVLYGLDPADPFDAGLDPDNDGLLSRDEFFEGTIPYDADSDDGGESDGSEVAAGRDPLYDKDDLLPPILDYGIVTHVYHQATHWPEPEMLILHFPVHPNYTAMQIWRFDPGGAAFLLHDVVDLTFDPSGVYYDKALSNGLPYRYYLVAEGLSGSTTGPTEIFAGVPKADPIPPYVTISINNGYPVTGSRDVLLRFSTSADTVEMQVSEDSSFDGMAWTPFTSQSYQNLAAGGPGSYLATVFIRVRDAAGNISSPSEATVIVDEGGDFDGDSISNALDPDDDGDGVDDVDEIGTHLSNSLDAETDGDGISDGDEVAAGTDPIDHLSPLTIVPALNGFSRILLVLLLAAVLALSRKRAHA